MERRAGQWSGGMDSVSGQRFPALGFRNYRLFWIGGVISNNGRWIQTVASYFIVYQISESAAWVGVAAFASFIPNLLTNPVAGYISDRFDRRKVLIWTNFGSSAIAAFMAIAWSAGLRDVGAWVGLLLAAGFVFGIQLPTWQSFVAECVPRQQLRNAITLNSTQFNAARTFGPAIGGLLLGTAGPGWALAVAAASYGPVIASLLAIRAAELFGTGLSADAINASVLGGYRDSIRYVLNAPGIRVALITVTLISTMGNPVVQQIVVFAEEVFEVSPFWFGVLGSAQGMGALLVAPLVAGEMERMKRSRVQMFATWGFGLAILLFSVSPTFWMGFACLGLIGSMHLMSATNLNTTVQLQVDDEMRGRVMAVYLLGVLGVAPFANLVMGWLISLFGARPVVAAAGIVVIVGGVILQASGRYRHLDN